LTASDLNSEFNNILNNPVSLISPLTGAVDFDGQTLTLDAAAATQVVSTAAVSWNFTSGAKAGTPATTGSIANYSAQTFTDSNTAASGTATAYVGYAIQRPTLAATNATVTTTDAATLYVPNSPAAGTNQTITNAWSMWTDDGRGRHDLTSSTPSATSATLRSLYMPAVTATVTGSTAITTATGFNHVEIGRPTISAASALTVTHSAALYIENAPVGGGAGPATITNPYTLWTDDGRVRHDGQMTVAGGIGPNDVQNVGIAATVATKALTVAFKTKALTDPTAGDPVVISFRNVTLTTGDYVARTITAATSVVAPSGATLGFTASQTGYVYVYALDNAGTGELILSGSNHWDEGTVQSTTAISATADSGSVLYSTTARTNVPIRFVTRIKIQTGAVAGEWDNAPTEVHVGAVTNRSVDVDGVTLRNLTPGTVVATTSGAAIDFTGIPSRAKRITILLDGVSSTGTDSILLRLGDSGGLENTGYANSTSELNNAAAVAVEINTTYMKLFGGAAAAALYSGCVTITLLDSSTNTWIINSYISRTDSTTLFSANGSKSLTATLDRVSIFNASAGTFDAGKAMMFYE